MHSYFKKIIVIIGLGCSSVFAASIDPSKHNIYGPYVGLYGGISAADIRVQSSNYTKVATVVGGTTEPISVAVNSDRDAGIVKAAFGGLNAGYELFYKDYYIAGEGFAEYGDWRHQFQFSGVNNTISGFDPATDASNVGRHDTFFFNINKKLQYIVGAGVRLGHLYGSSLIYFLAGGNYLEFKNTVTQVTDINASNSLKPDGYYIDLGKNIKERKWGGYAGLGAESFFNVFWSLRGECSVAFVPKISTSDPYTVNYKYGDPPNELSGTLGYNGSVKNILALMNCNAGIAYHIHN